MALPDPGPFYPEFLRGLKHDSPAHRVDRARVRAAIQASLLGGPAPEKGIAQRRMRKDAAAGPDRWIDAERGGVTLTAIGGGLYRVDATGQEVRFDFDEDYYYTEDERYEQTRVVVGNAPVAAAAADVIRVGVDEGFGVYPGASPITLTTSGLLGCGVLILRSAHAVYMAHVFDRAYGHAAGPGARAEQDGKLAAWAARAVDDFTASAGEAPTEAIILYDSSNPSSGPGDGKWMTAFAPAEIEPQWEVGTEKTIVVPPNAGAEGGSWGFPVVLA